MNHNPKRPPKHAQNPVETTDSASLIEYPCDFPIKILGRHQMTLTDIVMQIVHTHSPHMEYIPIHTTLSKNGSYMSITVTVKALNRPQLDAIYQALSAHPCIITVF
jgi:putative lipoic acid-binding regulatory protein